MTETVYRHRYCGCVRSIRRNVSPALHAHYTITEGAVFDTRVSGSGAGVVDRDESCPHELTAAHVAEWAKRPASEGLFVEVDGSRVMHLHARELVRVGVLPSAVRPGIDVGFDGSKTAEAIRAKLGIDIAPPTHAADVRRARTERSIDSWSVCERVGLIMLTDLMEQRMPDLDLPGMEEAEHLVTHLKQSASIEPSVEASALLSFFYGAVALVAIGAERRLLAYWACEFSRQTPSLAMFGVSIAQSLCTEMRYQDQLECVLGPALWCKFAATRTTRERPMLIARMAQNLLSHLTN